MRTAHRDIFPEGKHYERKLKAAYAALRAEPPIEQQISELKAAGWIPLTRTCWKAPAASGCAGCFLGPHGAWKAMKRAQERSQKRGD